jgi:hypothetical protein
MKKMQELMRLSDKIAIGGSSWTCKVLLLTLELCIFLSGCKAPPVSSAETKSPDGKLVATAHTFANSGFRGGPPTTFVYLSWATGSQSPTLILSLTGGSDVAVDTKVEMKWLDPTHLELKYKEGQSVDFQAIKWGDVNISLQDGRREKSQTNRGDMKNERRSLPTPPPFAYKKTSASQSGH